MNADAPLIDPLFTRIERVRILILCMAVMGSAIAYSFRFISFLHAKEAVLALALLSFAIVSVKVRLPQRGFRPFAPLWGLIAFSLILCVAPGHVKVPTFSVLELLRLALLLLIVAHIYDLLSQGSWRFYLRMTVILSATLVGALGVLQFYGLASALFPAMDGYSQRVYSVFGNQDLFGGYLAMAVPLVLCELRRSSRANWLFYPALILLIFALMLSGSRSAWLATGVGVGMVLAVSGIRKRDAITAVGLIAVTVLLACFIAPEATVNRLKQSFKQDDVGVHARWWIWDGTVRMIRDHPIIGVGAGNYAYWSPYYLGEALQADSGHTHYRNELHTLHAHSDLLELFAETGLVGVVCVALFLWPLRRCRGPEWGALAALAVFASLNATWQSPAHALVGLLLIACLFARNDGTRAPLSPPTRTRAWAMVGTSIGVALLTTVLLLVPSYRLSAARAEYDSTNPSGMPFEALAETNWPNPAARRDTALALIAKGEYTRAETYLVQAREGLDTGEVHFLQALIAMNAHDLDAAEDALRECLWRWPGYLPAWEMLLQILRSDTREAELPAMRRWLNPEELESLR
ncbi:MAG: O-antigen ligase family protein [Candidatus Hydrogenedentes bacterium]|nr:O-antigen ligase family protein [Candidatus Hydrogenedentota bacterium]